MTRSFQAPPTGRTFRRAAIGCLAPLLAVCGPVVGSQAAAAQAAAAQAMAPPVAPAAAIVRIDNFTFSPAVVTVPRGATVTWINSDDIPHTATATDKSFRSKVLDTDDRFSFTFTRPGAYEYFCSIHPHMTGKVIVK